VCGLYVELVAVENDLLEACMLSSLSLNTRCTTADCPRGFGCKGPSHLSTITPQSQCNQGFRGPFLGLFKPVVWGSDWFTLYIYSTNVVLISTKITIHIWH